MSAKVPLCCFDKGNGGLDSVCGLNCLRFVFWELQKNNWYIIIIIIIIIYPVKVQFSIVWYLFQKNSLKSKSNLINLVISIYIIYK